MRPGHHQDWRVQRSRPDQDFWSLRPRQDQDFILKKNIKYLFIFNLNLLLKKQEHLFWSYLLIFLFKNVAALPTGLIHLKTKNKQKILNPPSLRSRPLWSGLKTKTRQKYYNTRDRINNWQAQTFATSWRDASGFLGESWASQFPGRSPRSTPTEASAVSRGDRSGVPQFLYSCKRSGGLGMLRPTSSHNSKSWR